jgi:hypothetical protein
MTRKKDKIKQKQDYIRITRNLSKSRIFQKNQEEAKEIQLLEKIQCLPDVLIRIIYSYLSGKAKLFCNYKFEYLEKKIQSYDLFFATHIIQSLSKKKILDFFHKGVLQKYPDLIETIHDFYYLDVDEYTYVNGRRLFHLWEENRLLNVELDTTSEEEKKINIDWSIKYNIRDAISNYITNFIKIYRVNKSRTLTQKKWIYSKSRNELFLNSDKVFYLYKCLENFYEFKKRQ